MLVFGFKCESLFFFFSFFGSVLQYRCVSTSMPDKYASYLSMRHFLKSWTASNLLWFRNISKCCSQFISGTDVTQKLSYCKDQLRSYRRKYRILLIGLEKVQAAKNATWLWTQIWVWSLLAVWLWQVTYFILQFPHLLKEDE